MPLKRVPYRSLRVLLRRELITEEHAGTALLIRRLAHVKGAGRFTRAEFLAMCRWKSPRSRRHYERNSAADDPDACRARCSPRAASASA